MNLDIGAIARRPMFLVSYVVLVFILSDLSYTFFEAPAQPEPLRLVARGKRLGSASLTHQVRLAV